MCTSEGLLYEGWECAVGKIVSAGFCERAGSVYGDELLDTGISDHGEVVYLSLVRLGNYDDHDRETSCE